MVYLTCVPEFLLQSLWMAWNFTCWCILTTSELIRFWSSSVDFPHFGIILTQWNRPNLQLPDIFWRTQGRNGLNFGMQILAMVCWFSSFWHHFDLVKQVKFGVSGDFLQNAWEEWLEFWYADVSWLHFQLLTFWSWSVDFRHFDGILI